MHVHHVEYAYIYIHSYMTRWRRVWWKVVVWRRPGRLHRHHHHGMSFTIITFLYCEYRLFWAGLSSRIEAFFIIYHITTTTTDVPRGQPRVLSHFTYSYSINFPPSDSVRPRLESWRLLALLLIGIAISISLSYVRHPTRHHDPAVPLPQGLLASREGVDKGCKDQCGDWDVATLGIWIGMNLARCRLSVRFRSHNCLASHCTRYHELPDELLVTQAIPVAG